MQGSDSGLMLARALAGSERRGGKERREERTERDKSPTVMRSGERSNMNKKGAPLGRMGREAGDMMPLISRSGVMLAVFLAIVTEGLLPKSIPVIEHRKGSGRMLA